MRSDERSLHLIGQLHAEFESVLADAVQIALQHSPPAAALVRELEGMGYRVTTQFSYVITVSPWEQVFEQSLTDDDLRFLGELEKEFPNLQKDNSSDDQLRNE